jgi:hypothetical protein
VINLITKNFPKSPDNQQINSRILLLLRADYDRLLRIKVLK